VLKPGRLGSVIVVANLELRPFNMSDELAKWFGFELGAAIELEWQHGGVDFQSRFDKTTAQAQEMKEKEISASLANHLL
jgi:hypothetical protein